MLFTTLCVGQKIGSNPPSFGVEKFNTLNNDGMLTFEIDVRMADCLEYVEIIDVDKYKEKKNIWDKIHDWWWFKIIKRFDFQIAKKFRKQVHENDYFLKDLDDGREHIVMKCELITIKSLFGRKLLKKKIRINIVSKTGKSIYSKDFVLDKIKLLKDGL